MPDKKVTVSAQLNAEDYQRIVRVCTARREGLSTFFRRAVLRELGALGYLDEAESKALGGCTG